MKILITMKLSDRNLLYHIYPLSLVDTIDKIIIVRDVKGPEIQKVQYVCPPRALLNVPPLAFIIKHFLLIYFSIKERPQLIHSFLLFPHGLLALVAGKMTGRKSGITLIAGPVELYELGRPPERKYAYTNELPPLNGLSRVLLCALKRFDIITVAGSYTKNFLLTNGIPLNNIFFIPYTIVDERCRPKEGPKEHDLIFVGRLVVGKHVDVCIRVVKELVDGYGLKKIVLCIVGDGPEREGLEMLSRKLALENNIIFAGFQEDIAAQFNKAKASIITSERETGPLTAIESMICGVPVISSRCGDTVNDLITDGSDGFLINDYDDPKEYAKKIAPLLTDEVLLSSISERAKSCPNIFRVDQLKHMWEQLIKAKLSQ